MRTPGGPVARARIILLHSIYPVLMHKASFMTVFANTLVGWLRLTVSMLLLFPGLFIILCFDIVCLQYWQVSSRKDHSSPPSLKSTPSQSLGRSASANPPVATAAAAQIIPLSRPIQSSPKRPIGHIMVINAIPAVHLAMFPNLLIFPLFPMAARCCHPHWQVCLSQLIMYSDFMSSSGSKSPVSTGVD